MHFDEVMWLFLRNSYTCTNEMLPFQIIQSNNTMMWHVSRGRAVLANSHAKLFFQFKFSPAHCDHKAVERPCWNDRDSIKAVTYTCWKGFFFPSAWLPCLEIKGLCFLRTDAEQLLREVKSSISWAFASSLLMGKKERKERNALSLFVSDKPSWEQQSTKSKD